MDERAVRLEEDQKLLEAMFPGIVRSGDWFCIPDDERARRLGWTPAPFPVAFRAEPGYPGQAAYGIYVRSDARVGGAVPNNFQAAAANSPPFEGHWGVLSWTHQSPWMARTTVHESTNLLNFALGFEMRFREGV